MCSFSQFCQTTSGICKDDREMLAGCRMASINHMILGRLTDTHISTYISSMCWNNVLYDMDDVKQDFATDFEEHKK